MTLFSSKYYHPRALIGFLFAVFISILSYSQEGGLQNPRFKWLTLEDHGLNEYAVWASIVDQEGFLWLGTSDGLNRFDGSQMTSFKNQPNDSLSLPDNFIGGLAQDSLGRIWVGSQTGKLSYLDLKTEHFHQIHSERGLLDGNLIRQVLIDFNNSVWVATERNGLIKYEIDGQNRPIETPFLANQNISSLYLSEKVLYVGGYDGKIYRIDLSEDKPEPQLLVDVGASLIEVLKNGNDLVITSTQQPQLYSLTLNKLMDFPGLKGPHKVLQLHWKGYFFINNRDWLHLVDASNYNITASYPIDIEAMDQAISSRHINDIHQINEDHLLIGTHIYANILDFSEPYFKNYSKDRLGKHIMTSNNSWAFCKDGEDLWFGPDPGLLLVRNGTPYDLSTVMGNNLVGRVTKDPYKGHIWVTGNDNQIRIDPKTFDPENPKFDVFHDTSDETFLRDNNFVRDITFSERYIWGASQRGLYRCFIDAQGKAHYDRFTYDPNNPMSQHGNSLQDVEFDQEGNLWIASDSGVSQLPQDQLEEDDPKFINYPRIEGKDGQIAHNITYVLKIDQKGRIWIGTHQGLSLYQMDGTFKNWTAQDGFPNDLIYAMEIDHDGTVWLGTNGGLSSFDPDTEKFRYYGLSDGIHGLSFNNHVSDVDVDGTVYMGGAFGVNYFHPDDLKTVDNPVPLYFTDLTIANEPIKVGKGDQKILTQTLKNTNELEIAHDQFPFKLNFSSIDHRFNKQVSFKYRLLPQTMEWTELEGQELSFINLPAGNHTLEINGFSRGQIWASTPLSMDLTINPPWWASTFAYVCYALLAILLGYWFYRFQLGRKLAVAETSRLKEMDRLKTSLYTNITHEFRTPLTVINGMVERLKGEVNGQMTPVVSESMEMIERNGNQLLGLVNDMLDLAKLDAQSLEINWIQDDIVPFIKYLVEGFQNLAENKQITLTSYLEEDSVTMDFDSKKIASIMQNLLSNAIKFTPVEGEVVVHLHKLQKGDSEFLEIKVRDSGIGIPTDQTTHIFDRFYQIHDRETKNSGGTGIGLALCKELVEVLGGDISVKSKKGKGSTFSFRLPITNKAEVMAVQKKPTFSPLISPLTNLQQNGETELPLVLIVEDNKDVAHYLQSCLINHFRCLYAPDGEQGVEMAFENVPDVVISDVMMPKRDGFELCEILKNDLRTDHIPIVLLTAKATQKDRVEGLSHGADAYLTKPFSKDELFTRIEQLILLRQKFAERFKTQGPELISKEAPKDPKTNFVGQLINYIHENMDNGDFGGRQLAELVHLSESQLYRKIKAITDKSTAIFIRSVRLNHAKVLLETSDRNVSEVAYDCGFNNPSWFSKTFKEEFGFPPSSSQS